MAEIKISCYNWKQCYVTLPCPFCGEPEQHDLEPIGLPTGIRYRVAVSCLTCDAQGPTKFGNGDDEHYQAAVDAWNRRAKQTD